MRFKFFTKIKTHDIQKFRKEEHNTLLDANDEPNHEQYPFEEDIHFLLTTSNIMLYVLMFVALLKQQGSRPTVGMGKYSVLEGGNQK